MIQSMTGYGKAQARISGGTLTVEIRTLNGKSADINIKTSLLPKEKDLAVRRRLTERLVRGTIDLYLTFEPEEGAAKGVNTEAMLQNLRQIQEASPASMQNGIATAILLNALLRLPEVSGGQQKAGDVIDEASWPAVEMALESALDQLCAYRAQEGRALYADVSSRVKTILSLYDQVEALEGERIALVREKFRKALDELATKPDPSHLEQEMIFYLEKYDINEEKVRLRQHCKYFMQVLDSEPNPGKKLGFIIQEMGREINTTGSKANHAGIQQLVVRMKDELEKIREQSMNIL
jgi:uncharacterized protein (TIGR00255 family)